MAVRKSQRTGIIKFVEEQRTVMLYDYLVYICGVDVSAFVEELNLYYQDRNGQGSVDIVLSNPFDQWIMTSSNLRKVYRTSQDRYSEMAKKEIYDRKKYLSQFITIKPTASPDQYLNYKDPIQIPQYYDKLALQNLPDLVKSQFNERYGFGPGTCVFSRFDTVKIFIKNPTDPPDQDRWIPAFTGTVENKPFATDYVNGKSSVSIHAYDIRASMQNMRIGVNPVQNQLFNQETQARSAFFSDAAGLFADFYPTGQQRTPYDNIFAGLSFPDMVSMIITGKTGWAKPGGTPTEIENGKGIGNFKPGIVYTYANKRNSQARTNNRESSLEKWDNLCLFGVRSFSDKTPVARNSFLTFKECKSVGTTSFWKQPNSPTDGFMHFLLPDQGLKIADMIVSSVTGYNNIMSSPDWTNRYALVSQICQQIDYEWSVTGSGDIIFEFPMYDFHPEDFGANAPIYSLGSHLVSDEISDEGGELISGLEASSLSSDMAQRLVEQKLQGIPLPAAVQGDMRTVVVSNTLASKYGARIASVSLMGVVNDKSALDKLAQIEFNKRLADANKLTVNFSPIRPWLRPNRPLKHTERNRIGKTTSIRINMPSLREPTISVALNAVRLPISTDGRTISYQTISGGESSPLSYNAIFEQPTGNPDSGITVYDPNKK